MGNEKNDTAGEKIPFEKGDPTGSDHRDRRFFIDPWNDNAWCCPLIPVHDKDQSYIHDTVGKERDLFDGYGIDDNRMGQLPQQDGQRRCHDLGMQRPRANSAHTALGSDISSFFALRDLATRRHLEWYP